MKTTRIIAAVLSVCMLGGAVGYDSPLFEGASVTADAAKQKYADTEQDFNKYNNKEVVYYPDVDAICADFDVDKSMVNDSTYNIKLWFDKKTVEYDDINGKKHVTQVVNLNVSGIDGTVAGGSLHIYYDTRLTAVQNDKNKYAVAGSALSAGSVLTLDKYVKEGEILFNFMSNSDIVQNGVLCSLTFELPDDATAQSLYPIGIKYEKGDNFHNVRKDMASELQAAYVFTKGITNGYIKVKGDQVKGDLNNDAMIDGRDATLVLAMYADSSSSGYVPTAAERAVGDVNSDTFIDGRDATIILGYYADLSAGASISFENYLKNNK